VMPRPGRVLLVDDDADSRELYAYSLGGAGFEVLQAENGAIAVETAIRTRPDVVVMDLEMPVMGGLEAIRRLRANAVTRAIPVVVLSGNSVLDRATAKHAGCTEFLLKPCSAVELEGVVRAFLDIQPSARESISS